jgi:hypothetical protein
MPRRPGGSKYSTTIGTDHRRQFGNLAALGQCVTYQAGNDEQVDRRQLEERGEDAAAAGGGFVGRAQCALHDILIRAPVPHADDGRAEQHAEPREVVVEIPRLLDDVAGALDDHGRPGAGLAGRNQRLPEIEHVGAAYVAKLAPATQLDHAVDREQSRAADEDHHLHRVVIGHRAHAAEHGVKAGEHDHQHGADPEAVDIQARDVDSHLGKERAEDHASGEDAYCDLGDDEGDDGDDREHVTRLDAEAALEELRHGENLRPHVERHEDPSQQEQAPGVQLIVRHGDAAGGAGAGQTHHMFRSDVGRKNRSANHPPAEIASGQEVIGCGVLCFAHHPGGHAKQNAEVERYHQPVDCGEPSAGDGEREVRSHELSS